MTRWLAALLLLLAAVAASAEPVVDGFEAESLGSLWNTRFVSSGRVKYLETGADAVIIDGLRSMDVVRRVGREVPGKKQLNLILGASRPS